MSSQKTIVLITGANSGIGFETVKALVTASGSYHVILACRSSPKANQALSAVQSLNPVGTISTVLLDISDEQSINSAVAQVTSEFIRVDILINNAAVLPSGTTLTAQLREGLAINTVAQATMVEAFKPLLKASLNPRIICLSSSVGSITLRCDPSNKSYHGSAIAYGVSKAGLNMLTACYAKELGEEFDCKVWAVDPGLVVTNLTGDPDALRARGAGDPAVSASFIKAICEGDRDGDVGKLIFKDGVLPWLNAA